MITEIANNFYRITLPMPFRLRHVNAYALVSDGDVALFDTGMMMPGAYEKLETDLKSIGLSVAAIRDIYLTHGHHDHCGMVGFLQENSEARLHLSEDANKVYLHFQQKDSLITQARLFYSRLGLSPVDVEKIVEEIEDVRIRVPQFKVNTFLRNSEIRQFGNRRFEVIFTPGHAVGHVCFFFREEGILLAGDHILPYIAPSLCPNIYDDLFLSLQSYLESLCVIEKLPVKIVHPGHGNSLTDIGDRMSEICAHHGLKKQTLLKILKARPMTVNVVCKEMIGSKAVSGRDEWEKFMALNETYVYLQELKREGSVKENIIDSVLFYTVAQ